jgi:hypothetical protein
MALTADERQELDELRTTFELCWAADMRAIALWQATAGKTLVLPDHVTLQAGRALGKIKIQKAEPLTERDTLGLDLALHIAAYDKEYPERVLTVDVEPDLACWV